MRHTSDLASFGDDITRRRPGASTRVYVASQALYDVTLEQPPRYSVLSLLPTVEFCARDDPPWRCPSTTYFWTACDQGCATTLTRITGSCRKMARLSAEDIKRLHHHPTAFRVAADQRDEQTFLDLIDLYGTDGLIQSRKILVDGPISEEGGGLGLRTNIDGFSPSLGHLVHVLICL